MRRLFPSRRGREFGNEALVREATRVQWGGAALERLLPGAAVGVAAALLLTRLMSSLLYGVTASDPATYAAVAAGLLAVAFAASFLPARRASRIDPMRALRAD